MPVRLRMLLLCLALLAPLPAAAQEVASPGAAPVSATDVRLGGDSSRTRFAMDLDRAVPVRVFTLADPYRVIVDLPDVRFDLPAERATQSRGLVTAYRYGMFAPGKARIVIDVAAPVAVDKSFVLDPIDDQPARIVIDLVKTDRQTFMKNLSARAPAAAAGPVQQAAVESGKPVIVIDPGHGGIDPGASSAGASEKDIVLTFSLAVRDKLAALGDYKVVLTRGDDTFVSLGDRVRVARQNQAALFLSIHADTLSDPFGVRGATVYTLSEQASDRQAAELAEKENRADAIAGVDLSEEPEEVANILVDLTRRETKSFSMHFAHTLVGELRPALVLNRNAMRSAGFKVLRAPDVPSILLELGYLSSPEDVRLMTSPEWRDRATTAVVGAIGAFFRSRVAGSAITKVN
jgi:N-acetylmuramoyl-L-alanine amidase